MITVIIPTWNQRDLLRTCLRSLQAQTAACRVLVVDNGSSDGTVEMVTHDFSGFDLLRLEANLGFAQAVNKGIRQSTTEFVALLNNDTEADPRWIETGARAFHEYRDYSFFASRLIDYLQRDRLDSAGDCYSRAGLPYKRGLGEPIDRYSKPEPVLGASAGAAFYRRSIFEEIGLFDEDFFMYLEDVDFSLRAQRAGHRCLYLPDAIVYHIEAASDPDREAEIPETAISGRATGSPLQTPECRGEPVARPLPAVFYSNTRVYWITRNRWQLMVTYQPLRHLPWLAYGWARSTLFHLLKAGHFGAFLKGLAAGISSTPRALKKRIALRQNQVISTRQLCQLMRRC